MSKFNATQIATRLVSYGNVGAQQRITREQMRTEAATWSDAQKVQIDEAVVMYYAAKCGITYHLRAKASAKGYGAVCADFERDSDGTITSKAQNSANVCISQIRKIIFAVEPVQKAKTSQWVKMYDAAIKRADSADAITAAEKKEIRAAMAALASLLS